VSTYQIWQKQNLKNTNKVLKSFQSSKEHCQKASKRQGRLNFKT
jgi:hypothetical protein